MALMDGVIQEKTTHKRAGDFVPRSAPLLPHQIRIMQLAGNKMFYNLKHIIMRRK